MDGRLPCVIELKVAGESARGDTPLRALLEGLAYCAIVEANAADIASEVAEQHALSASRPTPVQGRAPLISTGGVSATRLASNYDSRNDLTKRLEDAGCAVDRSGLN